VYSTSTSSTGSPVFNFRAVDGGCGAASSRAVTTGRHGVYFTDRKGVYRTTGSEAALLSDLVNPIFYGASSDYYQGGILNHAAISLSAMTWYQEKIYLAFTND